MIVDRAMNPNIMKLGLRQEIRGLEVLRNGVNALHFVWIGGIQEFIRRGERRVMEGKGGEDNEINESLFGKGGKE